MARGSCDDHGGVKFGLTPDLALNVVKETYPKIDVKPLYRLSAVDLTQPRNYSGSRPAKAPWS